MRRECSFSTAQVWSKFLKNTKEYITDALATAKESLRKTTKGDKNYSEIDMKLRKRSY